MRIPMDIQIGPLCDVREIAHKQGNAFAATNSTLSGNRIDVIRVFENALLSIRLITEFDSNEIDETELQHEKHDEPTISTCFGIQIESLVPK
jgi:hypothetical protein